MKIVREVPISEITKAVTELLDEDRNGPNQAFYDYAAEKGVWRNGSMTEDVMRGLLAGLPDCNASTVFAAAANKALDLAAADTVRPFDHVVFGHEIGTVVADLDALVEQVEEASPLLGPVADMLGRSGLGEGIQINLGDLHAWIAALSGDALVLGMPQDGYRDKHGDDCYHGLSAKEVPWGDIEYLAPGVHARVHALVARLDQIVPAIAEDDAKGRFSQQYVTTFDSDR